MDIESRLEQVFAAVLGIPLAETRGAALNSHPNWDSLNHARLMVAVESEFGVLLTTEEIIAMESFAAVAGILNRRLGAPSGKVIVTDLDNTLWRGVAAEDGPTAVQCAAEGAGQPHYLYAQLLWQLQQQGTLLVAVSRNAPQIVAEVFARKDFPLKQDDFVHVVCSYQAKSAQISEIARQINLGVDGFTFVDDNPVELEEVRTALPGLHCLRFTAEPAALSALLDELGSRFAHSNVTEEDRNRTALYRRRMASMVPSNLAGADISSFLRDLRQTLLVEDRCQGSRERWIQLVNRTNQFNINGRRVSLEEIDAQIAAGAELWGATLTDKNGSHGEIIACLIDREQRMQVMVMSCRVFQRHVEHAFFAWVASHYGRLQLSVETTEHNEPLRTFLEELRQKRHLEVLEHNGGKTFWLLPSAAELSLEELVTVECNGEPVRLATAR